MTRFGPLVTGACLVLASPFQAVAQVSTSPAIAGGYAFDCDLAGLAPVADAEFAAEISYAVARMWNLGAATSDVLQSRVVLRVCFGPDGTLIDLAMLSGSGPSLEAIRGVYETARRAVNRAYASGKLSLPRETYDSWRVLDLDFDANGMVLR